MTSSTVRFKHLSLTQSKNGVVVLGIVDVDVRDEVEVEVDVVDVGVVVNYKDNNNIQYNNI